MVKEVEKLIEIAKNSGIKSLNVKAEGIKVSFSFGGEVISNTNYEEPVSSEVYTEPVQQDTKVEIKSTYVGILRLNDKKGNPISSVGREVKKGDLLCNVEVLEILHQITSPCDGVITSILLKDGDIVEYGSVIMEIKPS